MRQLQNDRAAPAAECPACGRLKEWMTTEELAAWLGVEKEHLYYLAGRGEAPRRHRIGKTFRYRRGDVEVWLAARAA